MFVNERNNILTDEQYNKIKSYVPPRLEKDERFWIDSIQFREMFNLSSAMGGRFAEIVEEMTQRIKELGPACNNGQKEPEEQ